MSFALAHLSDVHLGPLPAGAVLGDFSGKRLIGAASWALRRQKLHLPEVSATIRASIHSAKPNHIAFTGDIVNIAGWNEYPPAAKWLEGLGSSEQVSFTPGNHDAYVHVPWKNGLGHFEKYMQSDGRNLEATSPFPFVRMRRNIALIGLNSGVPQFYWKAGGKIDDKQMSALEERLSTLGAKGFYRVVMIHHPPLPNLAPDRKSLQNASQLQSLLEETGCELVLHGHNHRSMLNWLETKTGPCAVVGVASASIVGDTHHEPAGWNLYRITRAQGRWQTEMTRFQYQRDSSTVKAINTALLSPA